MEKAFNAFCKSSPYLQEEYELLKRGYKAQKLIDFNLIELLKEYSEIKQIGLFNIYSRNSIL